MPHDWWKYTVLSGKGPEPPLPDPQMTLSDAIFLTKQVCEASIAAFR